MIRCLTLQQLEDLLAGRLEPPEEEIWEAHLGECAHCEQMFDEHTATPDVDRWRLAALESPVPTQIERTFLDKLKSPVNLAEGVKGRAGLAIDVGDWFRADSVNEGGPRKSNQLAIKPSPARGRLPDIPGFEILGELGRGGMGVVYRARQIAQDRPVALKMILAGHQASAEDLGRFHDEAEAISRLRHPHIVQIFEVGQFDNRLYFVLEFVEGGTLADKIHGKPLPPRSSAQLVESLARAMHYAHSRGIIHRDLKPANVLLHGRKAFIDIPEDASRVPEEWDFRRYMPKITDFGLAKLLDRNSSNGRTASGDVVGTPSYMAPEQAQGKPFTVGPRTDVYSLGALLYEMLTGGPPFQGATPMDTLLLVHTQDPIPPRKMIREIPVDLETICLKCLCKDPSERYLTAEELAEDLRLFLEGRPIQSRGDHPLWRAVRRSRKQVGQWIMAALVFALSIVAGGAIIDFAMHESSDLGPNHRADSLLVGQNMELRVRLAQSACEHGDIIHGMSEMASLLKQAEHDPNLQAFDHMLPWNVSLWSKQVAELREIMPRPAKSVVLFNRKDELQIVAVDVNRKLFRAYPSVDPLPFEFQKAEACRLVSASPDGGWLAAWTDSGIRWWDATTGRLVASGDFHNLGDCKGIDLSPDGLSLALRAGKDSSSLQLLTRVAGDATIRIDSLPDQPNVTATAWHSWGDRLLLGRADGTLSVVDVRPWHTRQTRKLPAAITSVAWLTKDIAAAGCLDGQIRFWNVPNSLVPEPAPIRAHGPGDVVIAIGAGNMLVSAGSDQLAKLWNPATGDLMTTIPHPAAIEQVAFAANGNSFMTRDAFGSVRLWNVPEAARTSGFTVYERFESRPKISADGDTLITISADRQIDVWRRSGAGWSQTWKLPAEGLGYSVAMPSPNGRIFLAMRTADGKSIVDVCDLEKQTRVMSLSHESPVTTAIFRSDGNQILTGAADGAVQVWNFGNARLDRSIAALGPIRCAAFNHDGRAVIVGEDSDDGGVARVWSLEKPGELLSPPMRHARRIADVAWESDGKTIRTVDERRVVKRWDYITGRELELPLPIASDVRVVAYDSDGKQCLILGPHGSLRLVNSRGKILPLISLPSAEWKCASFSTDNQWVLIGFSDGVRLWDAATGQAIGPAFRLANLSGAEFVQNRLSILAWSADEARLWDLQPPAIESSADWRQWLRRQSGIEWSTEGLPRFLDAGEWSGTAIR